MIKPSDLVRQPNGTFKLKQATSIKSKPVIKNESARSKPEIIKSQPAEANSKKDEINPANTGFKFSPSVIDASKKRVNVVRNDKAGTKNTTPVNKGNLNLNVKKPEIAGPCEAEPKEESGVTIKYGELILFYLLGFLIVAFLYIIYDIYKTKKEKKAQPKKRARKKRAKPKSS